MNREFVIHLIKARRHLREAAFSLVPPAQRRRLRVIDREWRAFLAECLADPGPKADESTAPTGPRRIDIEE